MPLINRMISRVLGVACALAVTVSIGCERGAFLKVGDQSPGDETLHLKGWVSEVYSRYTVFITHDEKQYAVKRIHLGEDLASLEGMEIALIAWIFPRDDPETELTMLEVHSYELLPFPNGEIPIVGIVSRWVGFRGEPPQIILETEEGPVYVLLGSFAEELEDFFGSKIWVTGEIERDPRGRSRDKLVLTDYGIILEKKNYIDIRIEGTNRITTHLIDPHI